MEKVVAISTDQNYMTPVETLIKSIAYNNHDVKIYVINEDLPQEWFINLNHRLSLIGVKVIDAKIDPALLSGEQVTIDYLSVMTYARILIPDIIPEDRVLYLDADIIVDRNLDDLFSTDMKGNAVAAVDDYFGDIFNAGVLLMDNKQLRQTNFVNELLEAGKNAPADNDQTLLNNKFGKKYLKLPGTYNVQVGGDLVTFWQHDDLARYEKELDASKPYSIIHYTTNSKPWMTTSSLRLRNKWWQYEELEYSEIINHYPLPSNEVPDLKGSFFTFTNDENIKYLYQLAAALPEYKFNVAAYTMMGSKLIQAIKYPNVRLYPSMTSFRAKQLFDSCDGYLDINYGSKDENIIQQYIDKQVPVISFAEVATDKFKKYPNYKVFANDDLNGAIQEIKKIRH